MQGGALVPDKAEFSSLPIDEMPAELRFCSMEELCRRQVSEFSDRLWRTGKAGLLDPRTMTLVAYGTATPHSLHFSMSGSKVHAVRRGIRVSLQVLCCSATRYIYPRI